MCPPTRRIVALHPACSKEDRRFPLLQDKLGADRFRIYRRAWLRLYDLGCLRNVPPLTCATLTVLLLGLSTLSGYAVMMSVALVGALIHPRSCRACWDSRGQQSSNLQSHSIE